MTIGFDAKRAFHNQTGLGNHARNLINGLHTFFPEDKLLVFNPKRTEHASPFSPSIREINPTGLSTLFPSIWRSRWQMNDIRKLSLNAYHGLSHELPIGLEKTSIPSVVTMHDLIFEHLPIQYKASDRIIYRKKFKHAANIASHIIAISEATKSDLVNLYDIDASKISVGSNVIDERFYNPCTETQLIATQKRYQLPPHYFLSVGSIIERKNLLRVCKALHHLSNPAIHLVVIGKGKQYKQQVIQFLDDKQLTNRVLFLEDHYPSHQLNRDLPSIYHLAKGLVYPSELEGFGLPVVEAMASGCPVITSNQSSLLEAGGDAALFVSPHEVNDIAHAMHCLLNDEQAINSCIRKGFAHAQNYTMEKAAQFVHAVYKTIAT